MEGCGTASVDVGDVGGEVLIVFVHGRIITEKFDGFRAIWTGSEFILKHAQPAKTATHISLTPPVWFQTQLPRSIYLDGELWCGYGTFHKLQTILQQPEISEDEWRDITYVVFDSPDNSIKYKPYMERYQAMVATCRTACFNNMESIVKIVAAQDCLGLNHMRDVLRDVISRGGEGIVLRDATAAYIPGYQMWKKKVCWKGSLTNKPPATIP